MWSQETLDRSGLVPLLLPSLLLSKYLIWSSSGSDSGIPNYDRSVRKSMEFRSDRAVLTT